MKRFKYSLENVLHYKEQILDSIKAEHGTLLAQIRKKEREIQNLEEKLVSAQDKIDDLKKQDVQIKEICLYGMYISEMEDQIQKKQEQLHTEYLEILKNRRILLAEDKDLNAEITETLLEEQQLKVERVGDGKECLRTLQEMPEEYYDMILMDIQMPVMNGYEAVKAIRQLPGKRGSIPVVALTANAFEDDR